MRAFGLQSGSKTALHPVIGAPKAYLSECLLLRRAFFFANPGIRMTLDYSRPTRNTKPIPEGSRAWQAKTMLDHAVWLAMGWKFPESVLCSEVALGSFQVSRTGRNPSRSDRLRRRPHFGRGGSRALAGARLPGRSGNGLGGVWTPFVSSYRPSRRWFSAVEVRSLTMAHHR